MPISRAEIGTNLSKNSSSLLDPNELRSVKGEIYELAELAPSNSSFINL
jgi:hypothetical protein